MSPIQPSLRSRSHLASLLRSESPMHASPSTTGTCSRVKTSTPASRRIESKLSLTSPTNVTLKLQNDSLFDDSDDSLLVAASQQFEAEQQAAARRGAANMGVGSSPNLRKSVAPVRKTSGLVSNSTSASTTHSSNNMNLKPCSGKVLFGGSKSSQNCVNKTSSSGSGVTIRYPASRNFSNTSSSSSTFKRPTQKLGQLQGRNFLNKNTTGSSAQTRNQRSLMTLSVV